MKDKAVAVLIPCYNEEKTIKNVILDFQENLPNATIYVYDNNSTDDTAAIAKEQGAIVIPEYQQGKGNVIRSMFRDIEADCYLMVDGDDTYPAKDVIHLASLVLDKKADMAIGDRLSSTYFTENKRPFHNAGNKVVRGLINRIFKSNVKDIMTGARAFSYLFVKGFPVLSSGFEIETEMTIHALDKRFKIKEAPIEYRDRIEGSNSKLNTVSDGIKVIGTIFKLFKDYKPLAFFGLISLFLFLFGVALFIPVLIEFVRTGAVPRQPTFIAIVGIEIVALLSLVCGLILNTVRKYASQFYELHLNMIKSREEI